jgi:hypothetical protein
MKTLVQVTLALGLSLSSGWAQTPPPAKPATASPVPASRLAPPLATVEPLPVSPSAAPAGAQQADILKELPVLSPEQVERYVTFQTRTLNRMFGVSIQYDGMLPQLRRADRPLQMLNPFAPARYGGGFDNLSVNPSYGRGEGINLFAIRF